MVTGDDSAQVADGARQLAEHFWSVRDSFEFVDLRLLWKRF